MRKSMVITITSRDQLGLVERVSKVILDHGGNLEQSRMARLGGEFAGIMLVTVAGQQTAALSSALSEMEHDSLHFHTRVTDVSSADRFRGYVPYEIHVSGADHEGIVHGVAEYLARQGANIEELSTGVTNAPVTGTPLFSMHAVVAVPSNLDVRALRNKMDRIADEMGLDIEVRLRL